MSGTEMQKNILNLMGAAFGAICMFMLNNIQQDIRDLRNDISNIKEQTAHNSSRIEILEKKTSYKNPKPPSKHSQEPLFTSIFYTVPNREEWEIKKI